ncbi:cobalt-precorrin 5A hydrolase [Thalassorhabdus alkalitolerans]|uniref:Cobalt-precorrin 5A hydrolase n=1 Tax=Thalassorhabdus alkalitolerans TaxID=2282697 RepID=A0ABW0YR03_9BACI
MDKVALVAITKHGIEHVRQLKKRMANADVYYMKKHAKGDEEELGITLFEGSVRLQMEHFFKEYDGIVFVISLGAVVRMIAPHVKDKKVDPAVVVIDDKGEYVISVLSGHIGGANELTKVVARELQAQSVITTASDVQQTIPVDIFGREYGWTIEDFTHVTPVSASVVNEEPIVIVQESGEKGWWKHNRELPSHMKVVHSCEEALGETFHAALLITHRVLGADRYKDLLSASVIYRPKTIHLGVGCNRGTSAEEIQQVIDETLQELELSSLSVNGIATIDLKKDEEGLQKVCKDNNWSFTYYSPEQLNKQPMKNPSETVYKYTGAYGVSEPAALLSAGTDELFLEKKKSGNVTVSIGISQHHAKELQRKV